jgi:type II secretory pathway pseudopilin PulG
MTNMKPTDRKSCAFTLAELIFVILLVVVMVGLLTPGSRVKVGAMRKIAQIEEVNLTAAINQFYGTYRYLPVSSNAASAAEASSVNAHDFTYGTVGLGISSAATIGLSGGIQENRGTGYQANNSELIAILRDDNFAPEIFGTSQHIYNPQRTVFFNAKAASGTNSWGLGPDDALRDPWGMPYIVSLDLANSNRVFDATLDRMYKNQHGSNAVLTIPGKAMVWSFGPHKVIDATEGLTNNATNKFIVGSFQ